MKFKDRFYLVLLLCPLCLTTSVRADLRVLSTPHYTIRTDLETKLAEDLASRMEKMHAEYSSRLAAFGTGEDKFNVYIFTKRQDYDALTDGKFPNSGGVYLHSRNLLAAFLEGQGRDALRRTLQHEAFHQFAARTIGPGLPIWLNEGMAQVFEEGVLAGRQFKIGQVSPRKLRQLQQDMRDHRLVPFEQFLKMSDADWSKNMTNAPVAAAQYCQAWAMTHFLIFAQDESGQFRYRNRLIAMLRLIQKGTKGPDAFAQTFSTNYDGFQDRFLEYARTVQPTREATFNEYQSILADMLTLLASQGQRFEDAESFKDYLSDGGLRLRYTKGNVQWSTGTDPAIYLRDEAGRTMTPDQFYFSPRGGAPLADMVCQPIAGLQFRTIFHEGSDKIDHETLIESR